MPMNEKKVAEMVNALEYHKPSVEVQKQIEEVRALGIDYITKMAAILNDSRESSLWFTKFQESQQFAIYGLVINEPIQPRALAAAA